MTPLSGADPGKTVKSKRTLSLLIALSGVLALLFGTMADHDRYRQSLIRHPLKLAGQALTFSVTQPEKFRERFFLLEIRAHCRQDHEKTSVILNGRYLGRIAVCGHAFFKIAKARFREGPNTLRLSGLPDEGDLTVLEMKNLYGYSRGMFGFALVPLGSGSVHRFPWPAALPLAFLFLLTILFMPGIMSSGSSSPAVRRSATTVAVLLIVVLALPLIASARIFLNLSLTLTLLALFYLPGIWRLARLVVDFSRSRLRPWLEDRLLRPLSPRQRLALGVLALTAIFVFLSVHRQRYVGASDWYGYYAESLLFRHGQLTMKTAFPPAQYPAFAPLGFHAVGDRIIPQYPPGYPLLLALFGLLGWEFFVNALGGTLTILVFYLILRDLDSRGMALLYTALWAFFPVALFIAIRVMSDLIATLFILLAYYLFTRNRIFWSGMAFAYAVAVRPSCALFFFVLLPLLVKKKKFWPFCLSSAVIGGLYGLYNWAVFGRPWATGYGRFANELTAHVFRHHFLYYGKTMLVIMTPLLIVPALLPLALRRPRSWFYFSWLASFWVFYSFWVAGADSWWYLRFLLPGLPALFILSAVGLQDIRERLLALKPRWRPLLKAAAIMLLVAMLAYFHDYSDRNQVFSADKGEMYYRASKVLESRVPRNSLVGGLEMSGPVRLYSGLESFRWDLPEGLELIGDFLKKGRPVYLFIEPWNREHPALKTIESNFRTEPIALMPDPLKMPLLRVRARD
jgi:hypothetical protein